MGLLDMLKNQASSAPGNQPTPTVAPSSLAGLIGTPAPPPVQPPPPPTVDPAIERAKLEAEEAAQRASYQLTQLAEKMRPFVNMFAGYAEANPSIGTPSFGGDAAKAVQALAGVAPDQFVDIVAGTGTIGAKITITDATGAEELAKQFTELAAAGQIKPIVQAAATSALAGLMPPAAVTTPTETPVAETPPAEAAPRTRAPRKPKTEPTPVVNNTVINNTPPTPDPYLAGITAPLASTTFSVIVDAIAEIPGQTLQSFHPIFDGLCAELAAMTNDLDLRAAGLRGTPDGKLVFGKDESALAFGRAEGAIAALVRERTFAGAFTFETRGNRLAEVVADALRDKCRKSGGIFVWGRR